MRKMLRMRARRGGQVAVFLLMLLVALTFLLLWGVDTHHLVTLKTRTQNASDAASLAAARWQGISLNLIGELNLLHVLALSAGDTNAIEAITNIQARVLFTGPLLGVAAAQVAAKNNGIYANGQLTAAMLQQAQTVAGYGTLINGATALPEPYTDAWKDYSAMLTDLANDGIAAGPNSTFFYGYPVGGHILLLKTFYSAIANQDWCWFYLDEPGLLQSYTDYHWWHALPQIPPPKYYNAEYLPLWLEPITEPLSQILSSTNLDALLAEAEREGVDMSGVIASNVLNSMQTWYIYDTSWWGPWSAMSTSGDNPFPLTGPVKSQYNYAGADSSFSVYATATRLTPGLTSGSQTNAILATSAGKAFGCVGPDGSQVVPTTFGLVMPAFTDTRLIPVDASNSGANDSFDLMWIEHITLHLPIYMAQGPSALPSGCWYCQQLITWENSAFRQAGIAWLAANSNQCIVHVSGGGGGGGGGTSHGH